jgi:putative ABC transport system substrate-binding protein
VVDSVVDRRAFVVGGVAALAAPLAAEAQQAARIPRVGVVADPPYTPNLRLEAFRQGLRELGYVEGQNVLLEIRQWDGVSGHSRALVAELIRIPVDVLVVGSTGDTVVAQRATKRIPIVAAYAGDLLGAGGVASLARPEGNVTGLTTDQPGLSAKRLDLMKQTVPGLSRVAVFMSPFREVPSIGEHLLRDTEIAATTLGVHVDVIRVEQVGDLEGAFKTAIRNRAEAILILPNQFWGANAKRVGDLALRYRVPVMAQDPGLVEAGGLIQYGVDLPDLCRRAATFVDKILKGAKPSELPVEQPTKFKLLINLKTAKALRLTIPPSVLARADQLIE